LEGRFPQVSGVSFTFNPDHPAGSRVEPRLVRIGDEWLDLDEKYALCVKAYMHSGCDGYSMFKTCPVLMDEDSCPELGKGSFDVLIDLIVNWEMFASGLAIQNHFKSIDLKMGKGGGRHSKHRQSLVTLSRRHSMVQMLENLELDGPSPLRLHHQPNHPPVAMSASSKVSFIRPTGLN
jgi:5'-nucleotidase